MLTEKLNYTPWPLEVLEGSQTPYSSWPFTKKALSSFFKMIPLIWNIIADIIQLYLVEMKCNIPVIWLDNSVLFNFL